MGRFKFKKFEIEHDRSAMKVNTDGVLLAAWMSLPAGAHSAGTPSAGALRLLDIGAGSGVLSIVAAQRVMDELKASERESVWIDGVEIDESSSLDADINFKNASSSFLPPTFKLQIHNCSLQSFYKNFDDSTPKYDLIFSNPPYFVNSLENDNEAKSKARHAASLPQSDLINALTGMLREGGRAAIVLPTAEAAAFLDKISFIRGQASRSGHLSLELRRLCEVKTTSRKSAKRLLLEFEQVQGFAKRVEWVKEELVIMENGEFTQQYRALTSPFYLAL